jgi:hypothetical protein
MKHFAVVTFFVCSACVPAALAQKWEIGAGVGGSFYTSQTFSNAVGRADAGLSNAVAVSAWLGNNPGKLLGGELRYDYESSGLKLSGSGADARFSGHTNAFHYDFVLNMAASEARVRPFLSAGGGVKLFTGTGQETPVQPLSNIGFLTRTTETKGLISIGGGMKFNLARAAQLRLEVHDNLTPFPKSVIAPAAGTKVGGWLQDFVVMAGISFLF